MKQYLKKLIKKIVSTFGYEIRKSQYANDDLIEKLYRQYSVTSLNEKKFYNIGAGGFRHKYWTNVDLIHDRYSCFVKNVDIEYDITSNKPLPIDKCSAECAYTSHTIEHVWDENVRNLFREVYRILKQGGVFRVTCPDIDLAINAYKKNDLSFFRAIGIKEGTIEECLTNYCSSVLDEESPEKMTPTVLKNLFKKSASLLFACDLLSKKSDENLQKKEPGQHVNWFNKDKVIKMLKEAGFRQIYISGQQQSIEPVMRDFRYFDNSSPLRSLYMDAVK